MLIYREGGREVRELVPEEVLYDEEHLRLLRDVVVTLEHPDQMVNPTNQERFNAGNISGEVRKLADGSIGAPIILRRDDLLNAVKTRAKTELSEGYRAEIRNESGVHPVYGPYDRVQTKRVPNHVAVTGRARGGRTLAIRLDADGDSEPMPVASLAQPQPRTAPSGRKETAVKTPALMALQHLVDGFGKVRLDNMSEEEASAKAMEVLQGAAGIDGRITKALGQAASMDEMRAQKAALEKALAKVQGDLATVETEKARLTQANAEMKTELDAAKADMAKVIEPEMAVAQALDGDMPTDPLKRMDNARADSLAERIHKSLAARARAHDIVVAKGFDVKTLGVNLAKDPLRKVNQAVAARFDSEYAKADANPAEIEARLKMEHAALKATRNDSADPKTNGMDFLRFDGMVGADRRDSEQITVSVGEIPLGSFLMPRANQRAN